MQLLARLESRIGSIARTAADRIRAIWWRARGARLGPKCRIAANCTIERPWRLTTGPRLQVEKGAYIKIVEDSGQVCIGAETFIGFGTQFDVARELRIGSHVLIAPGCFITDHEHRHEVGLAIAA